MRSYHVFASMSAERAAQMLKPLAQKAPAVFAQAVAVASAALKARPVYLLRQPFAKRAEAVRRALSRVASDPVASEVLAVYFLECRSELLVEWLDTVGLEHEEGTLKDAVKKANVEQSGSFTFSDVSPGSYFIYYRQILLTYIYMVKVESGKTASLTLARPFSW